MICTELNCKVLKQCSPQFLIINKLRITTPYSYSKLSKLKNQRMERDQSLFRLVKPTIIIQPNLQ